MIDPAVPIPVTPADAAASSGSDGGPVDPALAGLFAALLGLGVQPQVAPVPGPGPAVTAGDADGADGAGLSLLPLDLAATGPGSVLGAAPTTAALVPAVAGSEASADDTPTPTGRPAAALPPVTGGADTPPVGAGVPDPSLVVAGGPATEETQAEGAVAVPTAAVDGIAGPAAVAAVPVVVPGVASRPSETVATGPAGPVAAEAAAAPAVGRDGERRAQPRAEGARGDGPDRPETRGDGPAGPNGVQVQSAEAPTTTSAPEGTGGIDRERFDRLVEGLAARLRVSQQGEGARVRMHLAPRELGEVVVRLEIRDGVASAHLIAETADAGRLLSAAAADLRGALAERGVQVDRLEVRVAGDSGSRPEGREGRDGAAPRREPGRPMGGPERLAGLDAGAERPIPAASTEGRRLSLLA